GQPRWRSGGRGGQVHPDSGLTHQVEYPPEPVELEVALGRLKMRPGEDADGDEIDSRLAHQPYVFGPDLGRPLLRVVVTAVEHVLHCYLVSLADDRAEREAARDVLLQEREQDQHG